MRSGHKGVVRLVLDTNVVVSGLVWRGITARLIDLAMGGGLDIGLASSPALLSELRDVIQRRKFHKQLIQRASNTEVFMASYIDMVDLVSPADLPPTILADPDDDVVLATAVAADAHLIVTGDAHLLRLRRFRNVLIVNVPVAISMLGTAIRDRYHRRSPPKEGTPPRRL